MVAKNNHAMRCHAKDGGHLWISRRLNEEIKLRGIPIKVVLKKFLLGRDPVLQLKAMCVTTLFEKLVSTFGNRREDDFLVLFVSAFDRNHPVVAALAGLFLHSPGSFCLHLLHLYPHTF